MILKIILGIIIGGLIGAGIGYGLRCAGGACPLTCSPWGGAITGAVIGLIMVLNKYIFWDQEH